MTAVIDGARAGGYTPGMERTIDIHLRLSYDFRAVKPWLVCALLVLTAGDLASESVTLTTYYPAPSGVYTQMITTNNTYLARDGGTVGVGTAAPNPGTKLDVAGLAYMQKMMTTGGNVFSAADPRAADIVIGSDAGTRHDSSIMFWSNASASRIFGQSDIFYFSVWNQDAVSGANLALGAGMGASSRVRGNLGIGSPSVFSTMPNGTGRGYLFIDNTNTGCVEQDVTQGLVCGAGQYATFNPGMYVEGWNYANRGGQVLVQTGVGQASTQVWGLNNCSAGGAGCTGNAAWMTLKKDDSVAHIFCCPK